MAERVTAQQEEKEQIEQARAKLRAVSNCVNKQDADTRIRGRGQLRTPVVDRTISDPDIPFSVGRHSSSVAKRKPLVPTRSDPDMSATRNSDEMVTPKRSVVVSNPRHRRSRSAGVLWVDHQPGPGEPPLVTKSTIMQPDLKGRDVKTTRGCPSDKVLRSPRASRYCLTTQDQDTDGELQTKIYKVR